VVIEGEGRASESERAQAIAGHHHALCSILKLLSRNSNQKLPKIYY